MKKILSIILCAAVVLTTGCSGGSQEDYNSLLEENSRLKEENNELNEAGTQLLDEISTLNNNYEALNSDYEELKEETKDFELIQIKNKALEYCIDINAWMLGRPQSSIVQNEVSKYDDNVDLENVIYLEGTHFTAKMIHTIKDTLSPFLTAVHIASYEKALADNIGNLLDDDLREYVVIYRNYDDGYGSVIMHSYWYLDDDDEMQHESFFTLYAQDLGIVDEYKKIVN